MRFLFRRLSTLPRWRSLLNQKNEKLNAFVALTDKVADIGPNELSVAIKDNFCTTGMPTTCSSTMLKGFDSPFDATVVRILRDSPGIHIIGKTNCDEFGMGSLNIHSCHGPVLNPFNLEEPARSAGGSSGGSAAAVAAGLCDVALSTDTGGSTRLPASYCGIVGFKPSYGLLSRWGLVSYADSLDCVGVMAKQVSTVKKIFNLLNVHDERDPTSVLPHVRDETRRVSGDFHRRVPGIQDGDLSGLRVGIPQEYFPSEVSTHVKLAVSQTADALYARGATIVTVSLPCTPYALSAYYVLASAEASSNLARFDGVRYGLHVRPTGGSDISTTANVYAHTRSVGFGKEVRKRILLGTYALTADAFDNYFLQAMKIRQMIRGDFNQVFRIPYVLEPPTVSTDPGVDLLLHPSAIRAAPPLTNGSVASLDAYVQDVLTVPASLAGLPALSLPARSLDGDWPIGVSLVGQWGTDGVVLDVGKAIETK